MSKEQTKNTLQDLETENYRTWWGENGRTSDKGATEDVHDVNSRYKVALLPLQKVMAEISNNQSLLMTP